MLVHCLEAGLWNGAYVHPVRCASCFACMQAVIPGGLNHYFVPSSAPVYKFELGGPSHEACAGVLAIGQYLQTMAGAADFRVLVSDAQSM